MSKPTRSLSTRLATALLVAAVVVPAAAQAQTASRFSFQASAIGASPFGGGLDNINTGLGWEAQLRVNPSVLSWGAGVEQSFHLYGGSKSTTLLGVFLEPRYVIDIGKDAVFPYLASRLAVSRISIEGTSKSGTGFTVNGGGGFLFPLGESDVNVDLGVTLGWRKLGTVTTGGGTLYDMGAGINAVARLGLAIGL